MKRMSGIGYYGKRILVTVVCIVVIAALAVVLFSNQKTETYEEKYAGVNLEGVDAAIVRENTYGRYLGQYPDAGYPDKAVQIELDSLIESEGAEFTEHEGERVLYTEETSTVTWEFTVPEAGFYNIYVEYNHVQSRSIDAERAVY